MPDFEVWGDVLVVVRKGCTVIIRVRLRVFDLYKKFRWYFVGSWGLGDFLKRDHKSHTFGL